MAYTATSRYLHGSSARLLTSAGTYQVTVFRSIPASQGTPFTLYLWANGDTPDSVAAKFLSDPTLWWEIADANPEVLDMLSIPIGTLIRIPSSLTASTSQATVLQ